ncbi:glycosyltransferase [Candidatus Daviesbacteria bacterium]|nr:glycosyltransferase [Candidatus Daviesbacteria bacterium]
MKITFISSYVPRKCGIATYTRDLAVETEKKGNQISIIALENLTVPNIYTTPVSELVRQNSRQDYLRVAKKINVSSSEIVHLQHEFGLFGGEDGKHILTLTQALTKPLIVTFHTVLFNPTESQKYIIQELARLSSKVIVMDQITKDRLENIYGLNPADIAIILHGAPKVINTRRNESKKRINFPNTFLMLANNLLSRNKGIEYGIEAVAKAIKYIPNLIFLIVGETHPVVKAQEGESYREELTLLVKKLGLKKNVIFINKYVSIEELKNFLGAADVYITPYLDPEQTVSGTLSYAIGAGKACIATEYVYAKEMLSNNKGIIVPFRDSSSISEALIKLFNSPSELHRLERSIGVFSEKMSWLRVSEKHMHVYKKIVLARFNIQQKVQDFIKSPTNISHLLYLTNNTGVVQHASKTTPDLQFGYSSDDNARALIVVSQIYSKNHSEEISRLIKLYSKFLKVAQEPNGKIHTFLNSKEDWDDQAGVTDAFGRSLWGLGFHIYTSKDHFSTADMDNIFQKSMQQFDNILDLRTAAYSILGLYYYILAFKNNVMVVKEATKHLVKLASFLKDSYEKNRSDNWEWFEKDITYDNFRIPQALFAAFLITKNDNFKIVAEASLKFLLELNLDDKNKFFDFIGQDGWHSQDGKKAIYDQQPLEAAGAIEANIFASIALKDDSYLDNSLLAFEWFLGNNRNHRSIYDDKSKGVADGLTPRGVNLNQGAESIVCFLMSLLSLKKHMLQDKIAKYPRDRFLPKRVTTKPVEVAGLVYH